MRTNSQNVGRTFCFYLISTGFLLYFGNFGLLIIKGSRERTLSPIADYVLSEELCPQLRTSSVRFVLTVFVFILLPFL